MKTKLYLFFVIVAIFTYGFSGYSIAQTSEIIIGNETNLNKQFPINRMTNYSRCELIYTQQEIGQVGWINEISFYKGNDGADGDISNVKVYIKTTSDYELYNGLWDTTGYKEVFSGIITNGIDQGWRTIILSEPYLYTGDENLAITVEHGFQALTNDVPLWQYTRLENGTKRCRIGFNDNQIPDSLFNRVGRPNLRILMAPIETETDFLTIGTETKGSKLFPINRQFNYSRWEGLYTSDELGPEGVIYSIAFYKTNTLADGEISNVKVYFKHTTQTEFNNDGDWLADGYTVVYEGSLSDDPNPGWRTITLTQPFRYNGNDNLAITVDHGYQLFTDNYPEWQYSKTTGKMSRVGNKDNQMPVKLNEKTGRPNIKLDIGCKLPIAHAGVDHFICGGDSVILGDSVAATGGFSPYIYKWEPGKWINSTEIEHPTVSPLETISYNLVVVDNVGCKSFPDKVTVYVSSPNDEFSFRTDTTIKVCQGRFFDSGGEKSEYKYNEDYTVTIYPCDVYNKVVVNFLKFDLEYGKFCNDYLAIYDGPNTNSPLIGSYCGVNSPGYVNSTNPDGALTFVFHSDKDVTSAGWVADIKCEKKSCTELAGTPVITFDGDYCTPGEATVSLTNNIGTFLKWEYSKDNINYSDVPGGDVNPYTTYVKSTVYVRAVVESNGEKCNTSAVVFRVGKKFYVNDRNSENDIYCTKTGWDGNDGLSPDFPKETVQSILKEYDVSGCDTIFIDAGIYNENIIFTMSDIGANDAKIVLKGASSKLTEFHSIHKEGTTIPAVFRFREASFIKVVDFTFIGDDYTDNNILINNSNNIIIESCQIINSKSYNILIQGDKLWADNNIINKNEISSGSGVKIEGYCRETTISNNSISIQGQDQNDYAVSILNNNFTPSGININHNYIRSYRNGICLRSENTPIEKVDILRNVINVDPDPSFPGSGINMMNVGTNNEITKIHGNLIFGSIEAITMEDNVKNADIFNNFISKSEIGINVRKNTSINNNLYFNSFYNSRINLNFVDGVISTWKIVNNIFYNTSNDNNSACLVFPEYNFSFSTLDYNLYYAPNNAGIVSFNGNKNICQNLAEWNASSITYGTGNEDVHSKEGDPSFLSKENGNLNVDETSIAFNSGLKILGIETDFNGFNLNDPPSIGASYGLQYGSTDAYAELKKELDGAYSIFTENCVKIHYIEEYNVEQSARLNYKIYKLDGAHLSSSTRQVFQTGSLDYSKEKIQFGNNWLKLQLLSNSSNSIGYYLLEVENPKKEKFFLRFKNKPGAPFASDDFIDSILNSDL